MGCSVSRRLADQTILSPVLHLTLLAVIIHLILRSCPPF